MSPIVLVLGLLIFYFWKASRDKKRFFERLEAEAGAVKVKGDVYEITAGQLKIEARYRQGRRRAVFIMSVPVASPASFQATSGRKWVKLLRLFGKGRIVATQDPDWDEKIYFDTNSPEWGQAYLTPERRQALSTFFKPGFYALELDGGSLTAVWSPFSFKSDADVNFVKEAVAAIGVLTTEIPAMEHYTPHVYLGERWFDGRKKAAWITMFAILFFAGVFTRGEPLDAGAVALKGFGIGLALFMMFMGIALHRLGGRAWFPNFITRIGLPALVWLPLLCVRTLAFVNDNLDGSAPTERRALVVDKHESASDRDKTYTLKVKSWNAGRETEDVEVTREEYQRAVLNQTSVKMETKPGKLGYEWIEARSFETVTMSTEAVALSSSTVSVSTEAAVAPSSAAVPGKP